MANSEDSDEMLHDAKTKLIFRERNTICLEIITCDPSIYTMDHPDFIVCNFMENFIGLKWVKELLAVYL